MYADRDWGASGRILTVVGFAVLMATLTVVNIGDSGVLQDLMLGDVLTVTSSAAFVLLVGGLALRDRRWSEWGFLLASLTYALRASFIPAHRRTVSDGGVAESGCRDRRLRTVPVGSVGGPVPHFAGWLMDPAIAQALAALLSAISTAILMAAAYYWGPNARRKRRNDKEDNDE